MKFEVTGTVSFIDVKKSASGVVYAHLGVIEDTIRRDQLGKAVIDPETGYPEKLRSDKYTMTLFGEQALGARDHGAVGDFVQFKGRVETKEYEDKEGNKRTGQDFIVTDIRVLSSKKDRTEEAATEEAPAPEETKKKKAPRRKAA